MRTPAVLHVFNYFKPAFSGEGIFTERLTAALSQIQPDLHHEVAVLDVATPPVTEKYVGIRQVTYFGKQSTSYFRRRLVFNLWLLRNLHRFSCIHFHTLADRSGASLALCMLAGKRVVLSSTLDDDIPTVLGTFSTHTRAIIKPLLERVDAMVSISERLHAGNQHHVGDRSVLIPIGIPLPAHDPAKGHETRLRYDVPAPALVVAFIGGICERKDPGSLISPLKRLLDEGHDAYLLLAGPELEPDYATAIRKDIAAKGLAARVKWAGFVADPIAIFAAADIMAMPSKQEGFGTVVIEAMACGLPVVARRLPGVNDTFVLQDETGYLYDNTAELAPRLLALANDNALRQRLGDAGERLVRSRYDLNDVARQYAAVYRGARPDSSR